MVCIPAFAAVSGGSCAESGWRAGEDVVEFSERVCETLRRDPLFRQPVAELELTREEHRHLTFRQLKRIIEYSFLPPQEA